MKILNAVWHGQEKKKKRKGRATKLWRTGSLHIREAVQLPYSLKSSLGSLVAITAVTVFRILSRRVGRWLDAVDDEILWETNDGC